MRNFPLLASLLFALSASAQTVSVKVTDSSSAPIAGASVTMHSSALTDARGHATVECSSGEALRITAAGFEPHVATLQRCADTSVRLQPATVRTTINVVVTEPAATATADEIARTQARTVFDAVENLSPAVYVTRRGVMGYGIGTNPTGNISIRGIGGAPTTGVLVVVDGRPDYQGMFGHPLPDFYSLSDAGTISVTEGPSSVLYGTNALGGVVEIRSREPIANREAHLTSSLGSFWTGQHRLYAGLRGDATTASLTGSISHTNGDRPRSAFRAQDIGLGLSHKLSDLWSTSLDGNYSHFTVEDPGPVAAPLATAYASLGRGGFTAALHNAHTITNGYVRVFSSWGRNFVSDGFRSTDRLSGVRIFQNVQLPARVSVDGGFEFIDYGGAARNISGFSFGSHSLRDTAGFARLHYSPMNRLRLSTGARVHHDSVFGNIVVPEASAAFTINPRATFALSASRGFRNPTIRELYLFPAPNPNLEPETLWNYQASLHIRPTDAVSATATVFYADVTDAIITVGRFPALQVLNAGEAINKGGELSVRVKPFSALALSTGYAYLHSDNLAPLVPRHRATAAADLDLRRAMLNVTAQAVGRRFADPRRTAELAGYTLVGSKVTVPVTDRVSVFFGVDNVLNQRYEVVSGYPMPKINAAGGFTLRFQ